MLSKNKENKQQANRYEQMMRKSTTYALMAILILLFSASFSFSLDIIPVDPRPGDRLLCQPGPTEYSQQIQQYFTFTINGQKVRDWSGENSYVCQNCRPGDQVTCSLNTSDTMYTSEIIVMQNQVPQITMVKVTDESLVLTDDYIFTTNTDLYCNANYNDADNDGLSVTYTWERFNPQTDAFDKLSEGIVFSQTQVSDIIRCVVNVTDGLSYALKSNTVSIASPNSKITTWHINYGELDTQTISVNNQKDTTKNIVYVSNGEFEYYDEYACDGGDCGDTTYSLRTETAIYNGDSGVSLDTPNPLNPTTNPSYPAVFPERMQRINSACFTALLYGSECPSGWGLTATPDEFIVTSRTTFSQVCSSTYAPYVICDEAQSISILVPVEKPIIPCNDPLNLEVSSDVNTLRWGDVATLTAIASCDQGSVDVTGDTVFVYDDVVLESFDPLQFWKLRATPQCDELKTNVTAIYVKDNFKVNATVTLTIDCDIVPELAERLCREMDIEEWVQFRLKHHTRGWTHAIEDRLVESLPQLASQLEDELKNDPASLDKYKDYSIEGQGAFFVPKVERLDLSSLKDNSELSENNYVRNVGGDQSSTTSGTLDGGTNFQLLIQTVEATEQSCDPALTHPVIAKLTPNNEYQLQFENECGKSSLDGVQYAISSDGIAARSSSFDAEVICETSNSGEGQGNSIICSVPEDTSSDCVDITDLRYYCEVPSTSALSEEEKKAAACRRADDPTLCNEFDASLYDRLLDRVVRNGILINDTGSSFDAQFRACIPDEQDICSLNGQDGCCYNGKPFLDGDSIWYDDWGNAFATEIDHEYPLFEVVCRVNSPGSWLGSGGSPVVCDATTHVICTEDGPSYETNITYQEDLVSGDFCAHDGTFWDWATSQDGTLDGFEFTPGISEICTGGAASIDQNCNAHKNFTRFANGTVDYTSFTDGVTTFSVAQDIDAFDASCGINMTGYVADIFGNPIEDATLDIYITSPLGENTLYKTITSAADGSYSILTLPAVQYRVSVTNQFYQGAVRSVNASTYNQVHEINYTLTSGDCRQDCTTSARPGVCSSGCHQLNGCAFYNQSVADRLNGIGKDTTRYFSDWNTTISACEGTPVDGDWTNSNLDLNEITCPLGKTLIILTSNVVLDGEIVELLIPVCE